MSRRAGPVLEHRIDGPDPALGRSPCRRLMLFLARRYAMYLLTADDTEVQFHLDSRALLFTVQEEGFYRPPDWRLYAFVDPRKWLNATLTALYERLEAVLPPAA